MAHKRGTCHQIEAEYGGAMRANPCIWAFFVCLLMSTTVARLSGQSAEIARESAAGTAEAKGGSFTAKGIEELKARAEAGDAKAQHALGAAYYEGKQIDRDYAEAVRWFQKAAEQEVEWAQYALGCCYDFGRGVKQDY